MALHRTFRDLHRTFRALEDVTHDLVIVLTEDSPAGQSPVVERWADNAANIHGHVIGAGEAAGSAHSLLRPTADFAHLYRQLASCQEHFNGLVGTWLREFGSLERIAEILELGQREDREWQAWSNSFRIAFDCCAAPIEAAAAALLACWQELAERTAGLSVTVNASGIGQQIGPKRSTSEILDTAAKGA